EPTGGTTDRFVGFRSRPNRHPLVPIRVSLVGVGDLENPGLGEGAPLDLEPDRQAAAVKSAWYAHRRQTHVIDGPRIRADRPEGFDGSGRARIDVGGGE